MATNKYVGVETEYGIAVDGPREVNPVLASSLVVGAYRGAGDRDVRWDHTDEHPMRDARGYETPDAHEPVTDDELGLANTVLTNGARFYVDHAHPEYATPECANARDLVVWDKAGERILEDAARLAATTLPPGHRVLVHKNNTDGKGAAYGTHENYLVPREVPFGRLTRQLQPFFLSRLLYVGAGRLGSEFSGLDVPFQLSQRADFFEVEVGLETTLKRPLMNTRDEPHADPERYRRLHVINGDANLCEVATYLKVGTMLLVLDLIEDEALPEPPAIHRPVQAFHAISHDLTARVTLSTEDGRRVTPLELQWHYYEAAVRYVKEQGRADGHAIDVLERWEAVLTTAEADPRRLAGRVDWATKLELLEQYRERHGLDWDHDRLKMVDLQYHDVRRDKGLYQRLAARGRVERLVSEAEIQAAMATPPTDTRAWFRGECLRRFPDQVVAAGWDSLIFDVGRDALQRVPMMEPGRGTREHVGDLLDRVEDAAALIEALSG
ncbi:depupylase/deamidase Dop [Egicoccus halophilus]|uniref:Proteasome accessory factor PafA2 n=1 Tax=Egicoccus halophilus TaxID=1670830 RepID=A0A8J3A906_9ACTN|nr:depupylase/deamidase Dop [Egicoccus halophilus]GGI04667.1 proteasome accessory factor PafA2 [Egicoccus halophilus]